MADEDKRKKRPKEDIVTEKQNGFEVTKRKSGNVTVATRSKIKDDAKKTPRAAATAKELDKGPRFDAAAPLRAQGKAMSPYEQRMAMKQGFLDKAGNPVSAAAGLTGKESLEMIGSLSKSFAESGAEDPIGMARTEVERAQLAMTQDPTPEPVDDIYRGTKTVDGKEVPFFFNTGAAAERDLTPEQYAQAGGVKGVSLLGGGPVSVMSVKEQKSEGLIPADQPRAHQTTKPMEIDEQIAQGITPGDYESPSKKPGESEKVQVPTNQQSSEDLARINKQREKGRPTSFESLFRRFFNVPTNDLTEYGIF